MQIVEICMIAIGLAMDALAVSICKGLAMQKMNYNKAFIIALYFGVFQGLMPVFGFYLGRTFVDLMESIDHWIAFIILSLVGINMIKEAFSQEDNNTNDSTDMKTMLLLAIATSIDAFTIGITFAFLKANIFFACFMIFIITFILCLIGVKAGNVFKERIRIKPEIIGGIFLILIGLKILLEHLNILKI